MCGLIFAYRPETAEEELRTKARRALQRIVHRGPDDEGLLIEPPVAVGHRRLAIIDLAASRQPMTDSSGRFVLTYNGEVYNYRELRTALEPHWTFLTSGDTEVVLAGLAVHGEEFFSRMEGMWALAFWDRQQRNLLLSRDRMGKKPLYYQATADAISCASELPALATLADAPWQEDLDSSADYLRYGYYLPGCTAYQGVREVLPGHVLHWRPGKQPQQTAYWQLTIGGYSGSKAQAREQLHDALVNAVRRRLVADVEIGAFLSGGVDSSLIVSILAKKLSVHPKTFTIGFTEASFDERTYASQVAQACQTDHYEEVLHGWDRAVLERLLHDHVGQPFMDASLLPTAMVSRLAARHVKVALSGDGGDELFSGYQRYQARALLRWYTRLPRMLRANVERLVRAIPEPMAHHSRSLLKKAHLFLDIVQRKGSESPYVAPVFYSHFALRELAPELAARGHPAPNIPVECRRDDMLEMMAADALVYLPQDILAKVDRASMAHSLESRAPFLDREVVELAFSLPRTWHRRGISGKRMLSETFTDLLPTTIWNRRKQGFGVPLHDWFRGTLGDELRALLEDTTTPFDKRVALDMLAAHRSGRRDQGYRLWGIFVYLTWQQRGSWLAS